MDKTIWMAELDRFGYTLKAVGHTEAEARNTVLQEYIEQYRNENGHGPDEDIAYDRGYDDRTYLEVAQENVITEEFTFGQVNWS